MLGSEKAYFDELKFLVSHKKLESLISFVGPVPHQQVKELYQKADVFINLSGTNSLDKAVLEAMSCGTLVLTTNPAFKSFFKGVGVNLYAQNMAALIDKIEELAKQSDRLSLQTNLRRIITDHHDLRKLMQKIVSLYK